MRKKPARHGGLKSVIDQKTIARGNPSGNGRLYRDLDQLAQADICDEDIAIAYSIIRPEYGAGRLTPALFTDDLWQTICRTLQAERSDGIEDGATARRIMRAKLSPQEVEQREDRLADAACLGDEAADRALDRLVKRDEQLRLSEACGNIAELSGNGTLSPEAAYEHLDAMRNSFLDNLRGRECPEPQYEPVAASEIPTDEEIACVWQGYIFRGHVTLLTALWKAGKTTLVANLLTQMADGGDLAGSVAAGRVLMVSEESKALWRRRCTELGIGDNVDFLFRPFKTRPTHSQWQDFLRKLAEWVSQKDYDLVVLDTFSALNPAQNENDASEMLAVMTPIHQICEKGAAVLLVHHPRKSEGTEGQASRGSGVITSFVDVILELRRYEPRHREDRRRSLTTFSRFDESPPEIVVELREDCLGYDVIGSRAEAGRDDHMKVIEDLLPDAEPGATANDIWCDWPQNGVTRPSEKTIKRVLSSGYKTGKFQRSRAASKGHPFRFWTLKVLSMSRNETEEYREVFGPPDATQPPGGLLLQPASSQNTGLGNGQQTVNERRTNGDERVLDGGKA